MEQWFDDDKNKWAEYVVACSLSAQVVSKAVRGAHDASYGLGCGEGWK